MFNVLTKIDGICNKYDRKDYPGIAIGVIDNGEVIYSKGYGIANLDYDIPINENTVFHVCSIAKQFTATCIALLVEAKKISLDLDIRDIFPQLKNYRSVITISNLVHMTNGLPDVYDTANLVCGIRPDTNINRDEFWKYVTACDWQLFKTGEKWSYGNTGYFLLGEIIRAVTDKSLGQYADENIFKPLGMNSTFFRDDRTKIIKNRAIGYSNYDSMHFNDRYERYSSKEDTLSINEENVDVGGAGQLWTTINDFCKWDNNFDNNILGKQLKDFTQKLTSAGLLSNGKECEYGWGLFIDEFYEFRLIHHGGWAGGYSAYYAQLPDKKSSVTVMGNHTDFFKDLDIDNRDNGLTHNILKVLISGETCKISSVGYKENNKFIEPKTVQLDFDICGRYIDPASSCMWNIKKVDEKIFIEDSCGNSIEIFYCGKSVFKSIDNLNSYIVVWDTGKNIDNILFQNGNAEKTFYPFIRGEIDNSEIGNYTGRYYCERLGVTYNVTSIGNNLFISNENRQNNALDSYYTPAIKDTFVSAPNSYIPYNCLTFHRECNDVVSFSFRDGKEIVKENFLFIKRL